MKLSKKIARFVTFLALRSVAFMTQHLSWRLGVRLGGWMGKLMFYLLPIERGRALENLRIAYGSQPASRKDLTRIAKRNFQNLGKGLIEILNFYHLNEDQKTTLVSIEGEEYLKAAQEMGRGVLLITGHLGNWELLGAGLAVRGFPLHVIAAPLYDPRMDEWTVRLRSELKIETISRGSPSSSRKILNVLRKKEILALLIDQDTRVDSVFISFFNKKANTPAGAARLALRSHAAVIMAFIVRLPNDQHQIIIHKPISLIQTSDHEKDVETNTARFTEMIEAQVKQYPDQWVWMHRRWQTRPTP